MNIDDLTGHTLGQYEVGARQGKGGMGVVYRGVQLVLEREVAIKFLLPDLAIDDDFVRHFYREAKTAAALEHAHIVPVYDYGVQDGISYVVMRLLVGGALDDRLRRREAENGPLPALSEVAALLDQLGDALDYAHSQGVIHRDIKPANIMFDDRGAAYMVDFGLAKLLVETTGHESLGATVGTPYYMPPEQWAGLEPTQAADQYALGVTLYQLVTGKLPFMPGAPHEMLQKHLHEQPVRPTAHRPDLPPDAGDVMMRALEKTPDSRWGSCGALAAAFREAIGDVPARSTGFMTLPPLVSVSPSGMGPPDIVSDAVPDDDPNAIQIAIDPDSPLLTPAVTPPGLPLSDTPAEVEPSELDVHPPPTLVHEDPAAIPPEMALPETVESRSSPQFAIWGVVSAALLVFAVVVAVIMGQGDGGSESGALSVADETSTADAQQALTQIAGATDPTATDPPMGVPTTSSTRTRTPRPTTTARTTSATILVEQAPVYGEPRTDAAVVGTLVRDQQAIVIAISADERWYHVAAGPVSGWLSAEVVRLSGKASVPVYVPPTVTPSATPTRTPTNIPTASPTVPPTAVPTATPPPTETPAHTPAEAAGTPGADAALFVPVDFERVALDGLGLALDYPVSWAAPVAPNDMIALLLPVDRSDPLAGAYPSITVARGAPAQLVALGLTAGGDTPQAALDRLLGADFSGQSVRDDRFAFPAYRLALRTADGYTWAWLIAVAADDWLMLIAVAPAGVDADSFHDGVLLRMLPSLDVTLDR